MTLVGRSITEKVSNGRDGRSFDRVTRIISEQIVNGKKLYLVRIMVPGYGSRHFMPATIIEKLFTKNENGQAQN